MPDVRDFLISSDQQMDKIIYFKEQFCEYGQYGDISIPHDLNYTPLVFGIWSDTDDFMVCHPFSQFPIQSHRTGLPITDTVKLQASRTNIDISANFVSAHNFYVRIYAFSPTDINQPATITSNNALGFISSSDFNYRKLYSAGVLPYTFDFMSGQASTIIITHNLGYFPQVMAWLETSDSTNPNDKEIIPFDFSFFDQNQYGGHGEIKLSENNIAVTPVVGQWGDIFRVHYRIYYDEA